MKIAIVGSLTAPERKPLKEFIPRTDPICSVNFHPHPWIRNLALGLARIPGNEVHVLSMTGSINADREFDDEGVRYHLMKSTPLYLKTATAFKSNKWKFHKVLDKLKPDIVHGHSRGREGYFAVSSKFPSLITNHGQIDEHYAALLNGKKDISYYRFKWQERRVNRLVKYMINVSPNCEKNSRQIVGIEHCFSIDNAIGYEFFEEHKPIFSNTLLFVGSMTNLKQVLELIKAVEQVGDTCLEIVSGTTNGTYYERVRQYIQQKNLTERITLVGYLPAKALAKKMSESLAVCLASKYESFGMVLAEAMAVGKPVIASNIEALRYVVKDNCTGLLFEPGNIDQLTDKISFLINNKAIANEMGKRAREEAYRRWYPDIVAEKTMKVYEKIVSDLEGT